MAATTLTQASEQEILKIFQVVASKTIKSVDGMVKSTQPKLNELIANTIDAFRDSPQNVHKVMNILVARMKTLGMSVDDLTQGMKKIPKDMQSLQDALRAKEKNQTKAEKQVQELRAKGIAAEIRETDKGVRAAIITKKEMIQIEKDWAKDQKIISEKTIKLEKQTKELDSKKGLDRYNLEREINKEKNEIVKLETKLVEDKKAKKGEPGDNIRGHEGGGGDFIDPRGMFAPIVDQFMGIKDSIIGPFQEIGDMGMRVARSFASFGKAMLTPIKSLKLFGASLAIALIPMLGWALLIVILVAVVALIIFKFKAIAGAVAEWWAGFKVTLSEWWEGVKNIGVAIKDWIMNIPTMLGDALTDTIEFIGGIGTRIWNALGDALESAKNFIMDGFRNLMNGVISLLNKIPGINIDLLKTSDQIAASKVSEEDATEGVRFMQNQWKSVDSGVKTALKIDDTDKTDIQKFKDSIAPEGKPPVIIQDNKTINNSQQNAETSMIAKADNNPEPGSKYNDLVAFS